MNEEVTQSTQEYRVFKYSLNETVELPVGSKIINLVRKEDGVFLYALVPSDVDILFDEKKETHKFLVIPTGGIVNMQNARYVDTYILDNYYAFHVFEVI